MVGSDTLILLFSTPLTVWIFFTNHVGNNLKLRNQAKFILILWISLFGFIFSLIAHFILPIIIFMPQLLINLGILINLNIPKQIEIWEAFYFFGWLCIVYALLYYFYVLYWYIPNLYIRHLKVTAIHRYIKRRQYIKRKNISHETKPDRSEISTGIHFLDSSLGRRVNKGDVIVFEGEIGNSLEDVMTHILYAGLRQGFHSVYISVIRPPDLVFEQYDEKIAEFNSMIYNFIRSMAELEKDPNSNYKEDNKIFWQLIVDNLSYELEKFAYNYEALKKFKKELKSNIEKQKGINEKEIITNIRNILVSNFSNLDICGENDVLPKFKKFLENDLLYIIDYNKPLIAEDKSKVRIEYTKLFKDWRYHPIGNITDIENLHGCLKNIWKTIGDKRGSNPVWQVWDSSSTIFHLTVRDTVSLHRTLDFFFHQASAAKTKEYVSFHSFKKGMHDDKYIKHLEHMADGVISLSLKSGLTSTPFKFMCVTKMKNTNIISVDTAYRINNGFVEKMWW